jgi:hypothetical protein
MAFGYDDALMIAGGLLGGLGASGESPREKASKEIMEKLRKNEEYFKSTPFSKEEIMDVLLPQVQKMYRGASDVVAGKLGAAMGETGSAGGQAWSDFYMQSLAPVIAQGQNLAAGAVSDFGKWYSSLDSEAKNRFMQSISLELQATQGLPDMNEFQRVVSGALAGINLGSVAAGNLGAAGALNKKTDAISKTKMRKEDTVFDIGMGSKIAQLQNFEIPDISLNLGREK